MTLKSIPSLFMYAMNIQNDVIGLVLRENCESKQVMTLLHDRADVTVGYINHVFTFKRKPCYCFLVFRKRKFKQWWWPIPQISIKRTIISQLNSLNTKRSQHMMLEIQVLDWNRHKYGGVRLLIKSQPSHLDNWLIDWLIDWSIDWLIDWLIDWCLTSSEQFFSYNQDENI